MGSRKIFSSPTLTFVNYSLRLKIWYPHQYSLITNQYKCKLDLAVCKVYNFLLFRCPPPPLCTDARDLVQEVEPVWFIKT